MRTNVILCACAIVVAWTGVAGAIRVVKIQVSPSGGIVIDGHVASLRQLDQTLAKEKKENGEIWYYREAASSQPNDAQLRVFTEIVNSGLHITLSTKPDFSDWVDEEGVSHPRNP